MKIQVTEQDIIDGRVRKPDRCAIAVALKRTFKIGQAEVTYSQIMLWDEEQTSLVYSTEIPSEAKKFIGRYDRCKRDTQPIEFELNDENLPPLRRQPPQVLHLKPVALLPISVPVKKKELVEV